MHSQSVKESLNRIQLVQLFLFPCPAAILFCIFSKTSGLPLYLWHILLEMGDNGNWAFWQNVAFFLFCKLKHEMAWEELRVGERMLVDGGVI